MTNSFYTIQITDNIGLLSGVSFLRVEVNPEGNIDKWSTTTFTLLDNDNYYECVVGPTTSDTIVNLKNQLDSYYIGAGNPGPVYNTTIIAPDTLKVELIEPYLDFSVTLEGNLSDNAILSVNNFDKIKYFLEYNDTVNVPHRFELYDENSFQAPIEVSGSVVMDYGQVDENLEAIRGQGLRVSLEANTDLTFEELFQGKEKNFRCVYYRDGVVLFQGWLNTEGFYEDFVSDKWIISFDCIDGLGYLKNLAFVNENGTNITGIKSQLEIMSLALRRTGIQENININIDVFYRNLPSSLSILGNVFLDCSRYVRDDGDTISSCEEVIRDVLEPYGAVLTSYNGQWVIYKPNQLYFNQTATFFRYDYLGNALSPATIDFDFNLDLGSQLDSFYPHYCNGNQSFTNKASVGAYRINYQFGETRPLTNNKDIYNNNGVVDFWTFGGLTFYYDEPQPGENGIVMRSASFQQSVDINDAILLSDGALVESSANLTLRTTIKLFPFADPNTAEASSLDYAIYVSDIDINNPGATVYRYRQFDNTWVLLSSVSGTSGSVQATTNQSTIDIDVLDVPINGLIYLAVYIDSEVFFAPGTLYLSELYLFFSEEQGQNSKGLMYTFQRTDNPSSRILDIKKVLSGDDPLNAYLGTLYKSDGVTPTSEWYRKGSAESLPILEIMGAETMRMNANTMRILSGDVFGYFNYLSVINLDQRIGKFGVTKYSYDTKNNIISAEFKQMFGDELTDLDVTQEIERDNVVEPTIRG